MVVCYLCFNRDQFAPINKDKECIKGCCAYCICSDICEMACEHVWEFAHADDNEIPECCKSCEYLINHDNKNSN